MSEIMTGESEVINMKRLFIPMKNVPAELGYKDWNELNEYCADVWENMGYCKDNTTRWYQFTNIDGKPCYTLKY